MRVQKEKAILWRYAGSQVIDQPADRWSWARLLAKAERVRYAVATGGNASRDSEARCRRSPAVANKRRDYPFYQENRACLALST